MHRFLKILAVMLVTGILAGCGPTLKLGENFYPWSLFKHGRNPDVAINYHGGEWTLLVAGQAKNSEHGFSVDGSQFKTKGYAEVVILRPGETSLPTKFRLSTFGGVQCTGCDEGSKNWRQTTVNAN